MLPNDVSTLLWMLIFFVIFYLYIDIRITKLRKEMLSHYSICESMLSNGLKAGNGLQAGLGTEFPVIQKSIQQSQPLKLIAANENKSLDEIDTFTEIIPTREEIADGLSNLKCTASGCNGMEWLADNDNKIGSGWHPNGIEGFNVSDDGQYAPFNAI